ncbi:Suppressor of sigma54-dependent transcription, PspA-like [Olavius sp. associated proteobacterium Delta 1]|nr:Suppressor of sigma54-dependent transcription, PspA-like [Olavius sp. associated proteobacterium Delta 1]
MKESLIGRVGRIISGSFNSLIDAIENVAPETVMSEAIREIDTAIDDVRVELGRVVAGKHLANSRLMEENRKHEDLSEKIELAIKQARDDLAEAAISRQIDIEAQIPVLEATISDCANSEKELEGYISALQAKKREMQEDLRQFRESMTETITSSSSISNSGIEVSGDVDRKVAKAESAFERIAEKATGIPGGGHTADRQTATKLAELEEIARKNRIQERLAAIKGNVQEK